MHAVASESSGRTSRQSSERLSSLSEAGGKGQEMGSRKKAQIFFDMRIIFLYAQPNLFRLARCHAFTRAGLCMRKAAIASCHGGVRCPWATARGKAAPPSQAWQWVSDGAGHCYQSHVLPWHL